MNFKQTPIWKHAILYFTNFDESTRELYLWILYLLRASASNKKNAHLTSLKKSSIQIVDFNNDRNGKEL